MASFEDRYELLEVWGRGAHGTVWKARERATGRIVAVKRVPRDPRERVEAWEERLRREAELLARVRHPGIVEVHEVGFGLDEAWLVTEFVDGGSLEDLLRARGRLAPLEAAALVAGAARALDAAHRAGVVHRDVKPGNLLLADDGGCKVTDFGVAGLPGEAAGTGEVPGTFVGTPVYTAPEQLRGEPVDARADVWSLGVVLWRCLAGTPPFEGGSVAEVAHRVLRDPLPDPRAALPGVPGPIVEVLGATLRRDREERPASALELARRLEEAIVACGGAEAEVRDPSQGAGEESGAAAAGPTLGGRRPGEGAPARAVVAAALAAAVAVVGAAWWMGMPGARWPGSAGNGARARVSTVARRALVTACRGREGAECAPALAAALAEAPGDDEVFGALAAALGEGGEQEVRRPGSAGDGAAGEPARQQRRKRMRKPSRRSGRRRSAVGSRVRSAADVARPAPRPAGEVVAADRPAGTASVPATPRVTRAPAVDLREGRGVVEVRHPFEEGLVELLVDGRRVGLVRVGPGTPFPPGIPVTVAFSVPPGEHRLVLRVLSATERVQLEERWSARWDPDQFRAARWGVAGTGGGWRLVRLP